jgi:hypothetical protein
VREYKMEVEAYRSDIQQIESLKKENSEYQQLILKYEKQSLIKENEYLNM